MDKSDKILVLGGTGMVGSTVLNKLREYGYTNVSYPPSRFLDLTNQDHVNQYFASSEFEYVYLAAAKVGGIMANKEQKAEFIYKNLMIQTNVIHAAHINNVKKLLLLGSSCIYPRECPQPMKEEYIMTGPLEPTNDAYAAAKLAGYYMVKAYREQYNSNFICVMPPNLYGSLNDNYDLHTSHVIGALIRKFHTAVITSNDQVTLWGTGTAKREFMHVNDLADACIFLMNKYNKSEFINIGTAEEISIYDLAYMLKEISGFEGSINWNSKYPDGMPRKVMDISKITSMGWKAKIGLKEGLTEIYNNYALLSSTKYSK